MEKQKPGGLTTLCIFCMVFGILGLFAGVMGTAGLLLGEKLQALASFNPGATAKANQLNKEMQSKVFEKTKTYYPISIPALIFATLVSGGLVFGGIKAVKLDPMGKTILIWCCLAALPVELIGTYANTMVQMETMSVMEEYMPKVMEASVPAGGKMPPNVKNITTLSTKIGILVGVVFLSGWVLCKLGVFIYTVYYLGKPEIKALYEPPTVMPAL